MRRSSILALFAAVLLLGAALSAAAQEVDTSQPIPVKQKKPKTEKFKGEVLHASRVQITVRSQENPRVIRTFSLSPELQEKMLKTIEQGGYQHGDKVEIHYVRGQDTALKIKGKPSRSR